jgi:hypothetical protein
MQGAARSSVLDSQVWFDQLGGLDRETLVELQLLHAALVTQGDLAAGDPRQSQIENQISDEQPPRLPMGARESLALPAARMAETTVRLSLCGEPRWVQVRESRRHVGSPAALSLHVMLVTHIPRSKNIIFHRQARVHAVAQWLICSLCRI